VSRRLATPPRGRLASRVLAHAMVALLAACGAVPVQNYYVLSAVAPPAAGNSTAAGNSAGGHGIAVYVDPAHLPEAVDRPQIVIGQGENSVTILEQQRWAEPLRAAIAQVIALDLARGGVRATAAPPVSIPDDAWRLELDVQRFESRPGDAVSVEIAWTLRRAGTVKSGRSVAREAVSAAGYDALVQAHSRALAAISREIGTALGR
jgi:uncharacterized lipoprotein YmbA